MNPEKQIIQFMLDVIHCVRGEYHMNSMSMPKRHIAQALERANKCLTAQLYFPELQFKPWYLKNAFIHAILHASPYLGWKGHIVAREAIDTIRASLPW